jgi:hypothetical protein
MNKLITVIFWRILRIFGELGDFWRNLKDFDEMWGFLEKFKGF